ncbi:C-C motif chemokine 22-like [Myxocyprinus asiaticus]|uniref:C-C motif chemokine 22-like n=1 Tax=Myxocyprinus asiaticus TaxID=70543 RepID=UPI002221A207|nr:C-C motif chemokine 22-like [Myxocyprinus asiaticus]
MRTVFSVLFLMLFCALQLISAGPFAVETAQRICCPRVAKVIIPLRKLESYFWTNRSCPIRHIVFITKAKKRFCVIPDNNWVKRAMNHVNKMKSASKSPQ